MSGLFPLPSQPGGVPWPTEEWPRGGLPAGVDLGPLLGEAFDDESPLAVTYAVLVVHRGRIVTERYHGALEHFDRPPTPVSADTPLLSWSMAKSVLQAAVGVLVGEGRLDLDGPAPVPEWSDPADARHPITLRDLLSMRDGLDFTEEYTDDRVSDTIEMLFGDARPTWPITPPSVPSPRRPARASTTRRAPPTSSRGSWPAPWARASLTRASCTPGSSGQSA